MRYRFRLIPALLSSALLASSVGCMQQGNAATKKTGGVGNREPSLTAAPAQSDANPATALTITTQHDPGVRGGPAGAGGIYHGYTAGTYDFARNYFTAAQDVFREVDSVRGTIESGTGLGPSFNSNSCASCHAQPATGGTSPAHNPQVDVAHLDGATNAIPSFITPSGPVREARFIANDDGSPDGGVHSIFTITGRKDAPAGCNLAQPDFATALANFNVSFRIPTPVFGLGLVEAVSDDALVANLAANASAKSNLGIKGRFNHNGNDGSIARFGWKAQNKSLLLFAGEAYNVEQGVTNEIFQNERTNGGCATNPTPEDRSHITNSDDGTTTSAALDALSSDLINFAMFMRLSDAPSRGPSTASTQNGETLFNSVGCAYCHTPTLTTGPATLGAIVPAGAPSSLVAGPLSNQQFQPFSDFAIHHMGSRLADGVSQGAAGPDEFRTAPLWGVGQRIFFLHDGRTSDLLSAIEAHYASGNDCAENYVESDFVAKGFFYSLVGDEFSCGSEANAVVNKFNGLTASQQQDVLNFLRSL